MPMVLAEVERQRLLQVMGFHGWVRRGAELPIIVAKTPSLPRLSKTAPVSEPTFAGPPRRSAPMTPPMPPTPVGSHRDSPAIDSAPPRRSVSIVAAQAVLLVLEKRVHADLPMVQQLQRLLPGCVVCTADTIPRGAARFALQLGVDAALPADVLGVRVKSVDQLRASASSRRALWWAIKPILRALRG